MTAVLVDTGPLVAAANRTDRHHVRCRDFLISCESELLLLPTVLAETCYMLGRGRAGSEVEAMFLDDAASGQLLLTDLSTADLDRMAELIRQYADLPLGAVDASVVAVAERLGIESVATLDHRHFSVVLPRHRRTDGFVLYP